MVSLLVGSGWLMAEDVSSDERARAAEIRQSLISTLPDAESARILGENLNQFSDAEAAHLLVELGLSGRPSARPLILTQLGRKNPLVVERALRALAMLGVRGREQLSQVSALLGHQSYSVRFQAIACLETIDDLRVCPLIIERLKDPKPAVAKFALVALRNISGRDDLGGDPASWVEWHRLNQGLSDERFFQAGERLRSPNSQEVSAAIQSLAMTTGESARAVEVIEPLLGDADPKVTYAARQALAQLAPDIYTQPTMRERTAALAPPSPSGRTQPVDPHHQKPESGILDSWLGLIAAAVGLSGIFLVSIYLLRTQSGRHAKRGSVNGVRRVRKSGRHASQKAARRKGKGVLTSAAAEPVSRLWVPNSEELKKPWLAAINHRTSLKDAAAGPRDAAVSVTGDGVAAPADEDSFSLFDRFAPVVASVEVQSPSSIFKKTEHTTRVLKDLRAARQNPPSGESRGQETPVSDHAAPPLSGLGSPGSSEDAPAATSPPAPLADEDPFDLFDRFSPAPEQPAQTQSPTALFTKTERTARRLNELRALRTSQPASGRHQREENNSGAAATRAPTDTSLSGVVGEGLSSSGPAAVEAVDEDAATSDGHPCAAFASFSGPVASQERSTTAIFTQTERTIRLLKERRESRLNRLGLGTQPAFQCQEAARQDARQVILREDNVAELDDSLRPLLALPIGTAEASADIITEG